MVAAGLWDKQQRVLVVFIQTYWMLQIEGRGQLEVQKCDGIAYQGGEEVGNGKDSKTKVCCIETANNY